MFHYVSVSMKHISHTRTLFVIWYRSYRFEQTTKRQHRHTHTYRETASKVAVRERVREREQKQIETFFSFVWRFIFFHV